MIDPLLSLAFSVQSNKGVYALLIGSGVSRSAGIPTGWEVVEDLIRKLAHLKGEDCEPDPAAWFKGKYNREPNYAKLLDSIVKSPSERSNLLRSYFEPDEDEREEGLKAPTGAHTAIAELVSGGYIRVIVTSNFDRLLEMALEAAGVVPTIISTPDAAEGALPLIHTKCTVIKLHGDYLDTRIKNTPRELERYDKRINQLLNRVFDEFGLIVCGWSAEWDTALRKALERCKSHRFTTFWTTRRKLGTVAEQLVQLRRAEVVKIKDAESFFQELAEKVLSLGEMARSHPLSSKAAVATLKKHLADSRYKIPLNDMVKKEAEKLHAELSVENFPVQGVPFSGEELWNRIQRYEALIEILQALTITGCYWGEEIHDQIWVRCLERIGAPIRQQGALTTWLELRLYPALILLYSGGIASIAANKYNTFSSLVMKAKFRDEYEEKSLIFEINTWNVMQEAVQKDLPAREREHTPLSNHLYVVLREPLREIIQQEISYKKYFDRFEYLSALVYADLYEKQSGRFSYPPGCFSWNYGRTPERSILKEIETEAIEAGDEWPPLKVGLFDGSVERFQTLHRAITENIQRRGWGW